MSNLNQPILVTGATGFIGSYLVRHLVGRGYDRVRALRRKGSSLALVQDVADRLDWAEADVLDVPALGDAMQGIQKVYHCAAVVGFSGQEAKLMRRVNQEGTANVVNIALDEGVKKLVHVSSIAALGRRKNEQNIDESFEWQQSGWNNPYGISKHLAEMEVWRGIAEGLNAAVVNPANVLGSSYWRERLGTAQFFYKVWKGLPFYPLGKTGYTDVRDVVRFMELLMESDLQNERFILCGENLHYRTVLEEIARVLGVRAPYMAASPLIREAAWRAAWLASKVTGKPPFLTKQTARYSARTFFYENKKSLEAFPGFAYTPIRQTIGETGRQFLECANQNFRPAVLNL